MYFSRYYDWSMVDAQLYLHTNHHCVECLLVSLALHTVFTAELQNYKAVCHGRSYKDCLYLWPVALYAADHLAAYLLLCWTAPAGR